MSLVRVPGSLQPVCRPASKPDRSEPSPARLLAAVCLLAASPAAIAAAQETKTDELPPITVETSPQPKPAPKAKKKSATKGVSPAPQGPAQPVQAAPETAGAKNANPYANPNAPYKVESSGSGKLTEPLVDTPRTITALPKEVIQDKGAFSLRELARQTPGVTIHAGEGGASFGSNFEIRGFNARNDVFVDGIRDPGSIAREVFAVEQLEIYKGPSGVLSGRGTPGGAFNFVTKRPDLYETFYEVDTTIGTDETFRTTVDFNQVVTPDLAVRANVMYHQSDVAGRDFVEDERWGGLISATARVTEDVKVTLDYYRFRSDGIPDWGVPVSRAAKVPFTELGVPRDNFYGQLSLDYINDESDVGTATVEAKLSDNIKLTNKTRVGANYQAYIATAARPAVGQDDPEGLVATTNPNRIQDASLFANQTELTAKFNTGGWKHTVLAGIDVSVEKIDRFAHTIVATGSPTTTPILTPDPFRDPRVLTGRSLTYDADITDIGYYIGDTIHLSEQWIINGGIRYDNFERDQVGGPNNGATPEAIANNIANNTAKVDEGLFSWHAGIVYKPIPIASFYGAVSTTEAAIGNEIDSTGGEYNGLTRFNAGLGPEETTGYEIGTKWELFDRRLLATAALFRTTKDNARTNRGVNNDAVDPAIGNAGEYRVQGVELGVAGNITDKWSAYGGIVLMDTEVLGSDVPAEIGRRLANAPLTQFALLSKYALTDQLTVGGQAIYQSEFYAGHYAVNDNFYHSVSYWRFDAMAEYEFNDHWSLEVIGTNLTDEVYYDAIYQGANSFAFVAPGRAGYATVKWKY